MLLLSGSVSCSICGMYAVAWWIILWKGVGRSRGMNDKTWRYLLIWDRCWSDQWRCRNEGLRCVATRRHTSGTGADLRTDYLEKTGCFIVTIKNKWRMFQCTANWSRARLILAFIVVGAQASRGVYSVFSDRRLTSMRKELTDGQTGFHGENQFDRGAISPLWGPDLIPDL